MPQGGATQHVKLWLPHCSASSSSTFCCLQQLSDHSQLTCYTREQRKDDRQNNRATIGCQYFIRAFRDSRLLLQRLRTKVLVVVVQPNENFHKLRSDQFLPSPTVKMSKDPMIEKLITSLHNQFHQTPYVTQRFLNTLGLQPSCHVPS